MSVDAQAGQGPKVEPNISVMGLWEVRTFDYHSKTNFLWLI
jgi:hypothetical protein